MLRIWRAYVSVLDKYPYTTQSITTGALFGAGDVISQVTLEGRRRDYDVSRTVKLTLFGTLYAGPVLRTWYLTLERLYGATGRITVVKKVATDQIVMAPTFLASFLLISSAMFGNDWHKTKLKFRTDYIDIMKTNYTLWPAVQMINFYVVPFQFRLLVVNVVALFFNTYLAFKAKN